MPSPPPPAKKRPGPTPLPGETLLEANRREFDGAMASRKRFGKTSLPMPSAALVAPHPPPGGGAPLPPPDEHVARRISVDAALEEMTLPQIEHKLVDDMHKWIRKSQPPGLEAAMEAMNLRIKAVPTIVYQTYWYRKPPRRMPHHVGRHKRKIYKAQARARKHVWKVDAWYEVEQEFHYQVAPGEVCTLPHCSLCLHFSHTKMCKVNCRKCAYIAN